MEVVLDSNVLFRTLISGGKILELFFNIKLEISAPEKLKEEFVKNRSELLKKSKLSESDFLELVTLIFSRINWVPREEFASSFSKAKRLLGEHEKDEDFVALCLMKEIKLWTYEKLLFKIGVGVSTKEISEALA